MSITEVFDWLPLWWPWSLVLLGVGSAAFVLRGQFLAWWDGLLAWEPGGWWPVLAAILPPCIPIARSLEENAPVPVRYATVAGLLLAVAVVQLYGQERNKRDRIKTEDRFIDLVDEVRKGRRESRLERAALRGIVSQQGAQVRRIADGITALAAQAEEEIESEDEDD